ncbi:MAG: nickel pincer cofactor biosynthesis protein LarB [Clostridiales Family XIII bacterium]|jgi:NCAIR mutase (PurE)-related protein|nr:nickel pincer cofactor biosynthesis protein LarB [Clostridiales Family XIII bacterium]
MRNRKLDQYLKDVAEGRVSPAEAAERLRMSAYDDIDFAKLDTNRELRTGRGEVVFGLGKTPDQVASIMRRMAEYAVDKGGKDGGFICPGETEVNEDGSSETKGDGSSVSSGTGPVSDSETKGDGSSVSSGTDPVSDSETKGDGSSVSSGAGPVSDSVPPILATKVTEEHYAHVQSAFTDGLLEENGLTLEYNEAAKMIIIRKSQANCPAEKARGRIAVVSGGTADMPIAEEAAVTAALYGHEVMRIYDVGVSGLHRLLDRVEDIRKADVVIAVAGMEGALASVISGLVSRPVVAVPTSIGYGITLSGLTPLFAMLGSCSLGIGVMNIDNGFGAAHYASMILGLRESE